MKDGVRALIVTPLAKFRSLYELPPLLHAPFLLYLPLCFVNVAGYRLYLAFLRSLVVCDRPVHADEPYTGSSYCGDKQYVLSLAVQQEAWLVGIKMVLRMLSGPILGALCDWHGRKFVLMLSIGGITLSFLLMTLACIQSVIPPLALLTVALAIQGCTTAFGLCFKSMITDALQNSDRQKGFVVLNHLDVVARGGSTLFVIFIQKFQLVHYEYICFPAFLVGVAMMVFLHWAVEETLQRSKCSAQANGHANGSHPEGILTLTMNSIWKLASPFKLLYSSSFLRLRMLQMVLIRFSEGWESIQDSFMISVLGWTPGDWDLMNAPISGFRELWGMLSSGVMMHWTKDPANRFQYVKMSLGFTSVLVLVQNLTPFGGAFMLVPRYVQATFPGDGGSDAAFFSSQFSGETQASANGVMMAVDNFTTGIARWVYARFLYDPSAVGWDASSPLLARSCFLIFGNALCLYCWVRYGLAHRQKTN